MVFRLNAAPDGRLRSHSSLSRLDGVRFALAGSHHSVAATLANGANEYMSLWLSQVEHMIECPKLDDIRIFRPKFNSRGGSRMQWIYSSQEGVVNEAG